MVRKARDLTVRPSVSVGLGWNQLLNSCSVRTQNVLKRLRREGSIEEPSDLSAIPIGALLKRKNFGRKSLEELIEKLQLPPLATDGAAAEVTGGARQLSLISADSRLGPEGASNLEYFP